MHRTKQSIDLPASAPTQTDKHSIKVFIPYYPHVNKQISSILQRHSVSSACTSNKNLRDLLSSAKSRQPASQTSNAIYQIPCKDCSANYCGQTSRLLHKRIAEHERYTRPAYSYSTDLQQSSAIAQHAHVSGHEIDFSSAVILAKLQHQQQLDLIEHAQQLSPYLNLRSIAIMQLFPSIRSGIPFCIPYASSFVPLASPNLPHRSHLSHPACSHISHSHTHPHHYYILFHDY